MTQREEFERKAANGEILIKYLGVHVSVATRRNYIEEKRTETGYSSDYLNTGYEVFCAGWQASKAHAVPEGWKLVPVEPTQEMLDEIDVPYKYAREMWLDILEAVPVKDGE